MSIISIIFIKFEEFILFFSSLIENIFNKGSSKEKKKLLSDNDSNSSSENDSKEIEFSFDCSF